jgi:D-alanyl-D-alanine dipeptidase
MTMRSIVLSACWAAAMLAASSASSDGLPDGFVHLSRVDPTIRQEMRYSGSDNFTGSPLPGYDSGECVLRIAAAEALKKVQSDLRASGLGLKVFDCYRPNRAVARMYAWAKDGKPATEAMKRFFPNHDKADLHSLGYIARKSAHSSGIAVDLTLVDLERPPALPPIGPTLCIGQAAGRSSADEIDMGTSFDCLDGKSATDAGDVSEEQRRSRALLVEAMHRYGFSNYRREWWHFTFGREKASGPFDFPVMAPAPAD